jgi:hypothetical protein
VVRKDVMAGVEVVFEVRAVGTLGWTWTYYPESGPATANPGKLLASEEAALAHARAAAAMSIGAPLDSRREPF